MDLDHLRIFVRVAALGSFTRTSEQLRMPKSRVSQCVRALEDDVGSRLFQRTTRAVRLTSDGERFLVRAQLLVREADELGAMFQDRGTLKGRVRVDMPATFARDVLIPRLGAFLSEHPGMDVVVSTTDRRVDVVREGFDCVLRIGMVREPNLTVKRLGTLAMMNCASARYLQKHGTPTELAHLSAHFVVHYSQGLGAEPPGFEYFDGAAWGEIPMRSRITVNSADAFHAACVAGLGIIQTPRVGKGGALDDGTLVEVLPRYTCEPMPVSLVHAHGRNVPRRVRAVMHWMEETLRPRLEA